MPGHVGITGVAVNTTASYSSHMSYIPSLAPSAILLSTSHPWLAEPPPLFCRTTGLTALKHVQLNEYHHQISLYVSVSPAASACKVRFDCTPQITQLVSC